MPSNKSAESEPKSAIADFISITRGAALAEMASGVAHELNQPLGAIATFAQAGVRMLDRPQPMIPQALEVFRQINQEALNAGEGIRRIRRLFDQEDQQLVQTDMDALIRGMRPVLDLLSFHYEGEITYESLDPAPVLVDPGKIQHVLFSLVQNGLEAAMQGQLPPRVAISVISDRYAVETSITDSGPGVASSIEKHLFRPFYTTKASGTGLGLASTHAIVEAHDGTVGFENSLTGGCRFWFRIPVAAGREEVGEELRTDA